MEKQADSYFLWGRMLRKCQGELLKSDHDLAYVSFLPHDLVMGGIPHTGSRHRSTAFILGSKLCPYVIVWSPCCWGSVPPEYVHLLRSSSVSLHPGFHCCHPPSCLDIWLLSLLEHKHPRHGLPWQSRGWDSELLLQGVFKFDPWSRSWYPTCCTVWPTSPSKSPQTS